MFFYTFCKHNILNLTNLTGLKLFPQIYCAQMAKQVSFILNTAHSTWIFDTIQNRTPPRSAIKVHCLDPDPTYKVSLFYLQIETQIRKDYVTLYNCRIRNACTKTIRKITVD
jgi:hypothetical protein